MGTFINVLLPLFICLIGVYISLAFLFRQTGRKISQHPDSGLTFMELVQQYGYPVEQHLVLTEDGYYLNMFRIKHGKKSKNANKKPLLMVHGMFGSADYFIIGASLNSSMPFILTDNGFDIWLANVRGTMHSRNHFNLTDKMSEYWMHSWHQIGIYDLSAMIDYILNETNSTKLSYIGHSQGTTTYFVLTSERAEYNDKIKVSILLAPVAYWGNVPWNLFRILGKIVGPLESFVKITSLWELYPHLTRVLRFLCQDSLPTRSICNHFVRKLCGCCFNDENKNLTRILSENCYHPIAFRQLAHYSQLTASSTFRQYDYGERKNQEIYGSTTPPDYNLSKSVAPVALVYAENDILDSPIDVERLYKSLPNVILKYKVRSKTFNHVDYQFCAEANELVFKDVVGFLRKYG